MAVKRYRAGGWLWAATAADAVLLAFGFYMAISAVMIAEERGGIFAISVAALFFVLPVFCILAPLSAFRAARRKGRALQIITLFAAPWVYAVFLVIFLFSA